MFRFTKALETVANVGIVTVTLLLIGLIGWNHKTLFSRSFNPQEALGETLVAPRGLRWETADRTLILAIRDGCRYCEASQPFYRDLVSLAQEGKLKGQVQIVMPESSEIVEAYVKKARLDSLAHVSGIPLSEMKVVGTPTILLVDKKGKVRREWVGKLSTSQEADVKEAVLRD